MNYTLLRSSTINLLHSAIRCLYMINNIGTSREYSNVLPNIYCMIILVITNLDCFNYRCILSFKIFFTIKLLKFLTKCFNIKTTFPLMPFVLGHKAPPMDFYSNNSNRYSFINCLLLHSYH